MLKRYELTDSEWEQLAPFLPPENTGKPGRPSKDNRLMLNAMVWIARSGAPWRDLPERYGPWKTVYSRFRKWVDGGIFEDIFGKLSLEAEFTELSMDGSIVQANFAILLLEHMNIEGSKVLADRRYDSFQLCFG